MELAVDDPAEVGSLKSFVKLAAPGAQVSALAGSPAKYELGVLDVLAIVGSSSVLAAVIQVLPEFLRSRKPGMSITVSIKGDEVTVTVANVDAELPDLKRRLDG
jgi:hypothetical protein